jgi:methylated-DNA-[protein]-cysteine S-methyltransferase
MAKQSDLAKVHNISLAGQWFRFATHWRQGKPALVELPYEPNRGDDLKPLEGKRGSEMSSMMTSILRNAATGTATLAEHSAPCRVSIMSWRSPLGILWLAADASAIIRVIMPRTGGEAELRRELRRHWPQAPVETGGPVLSGFGGELDQYFSGSLTAFSTPAQPLGTAFQRRVWEVVSGIPYGETRSYGWVALQVGIRGGARAVGQANRLNPLPLLIPCHRVTASQGRLGGYSSGLDQKKWLLALEQNSNSRNPGGKTGVIRRGVN